MNQEQIRTLANDKINGIIKQAQQYKIILVGLFVATSMATLAFNTNNLSREQLSGPQNMINRQGQIDDTVAGLATLFSITTAFLLAKAINSKVGCQPQIVESIKSVTILCSIPVIGTLPGMMSALIYLIVLYRADTEALELEVAKELLSQSDKSPKLHLIEVEKLKEHLDSLVDTDLDLPFRRVAEGLCRQLQLGLNTKLS